MKTHTKTHTNHISLLLLFACVATVGVASAASTDSPPITSGADVTIAVTIQLPEEKRTVLAERMSRYVQGSHEVLPALEEALDGKRAGDQAHLDLDPEHAFGPYDATKKVAIAREHVPPDARIGDVGKTPEGAFYTVLQISDREAVVDFNHPLAGKRVVMDVTVIRVRPQS